MKKSQRQVAEDHWRGAGGLRPGGLLVHHRDDDLAGRRGALVYRRAAVGLSHCCCRWGYVLQRGLHRPQSEAVQQVSGRGWELRGYGSGTAVPHPGLFQGPGGRKDLQKMIDKGYFGDEAYLNMELGYLFRSGQADADLKQKRRQEEAAAAPPPKETEEGCSRNPAEDPPGQRRHPRTRDSLPRSTGWRPSPPRSSGRWRRTRRSETGSIPS